MYLFHICIGLLCIFRYTEETHFKPLHSVPWYKNSTHITDTTIESNTLSSKNIEYHLMRLDMQIVNRTERIMSELRETNSRLQLLEWQNVEFHSALESFKAELQQCSQQTSPTSNTSIQELDELEAEIENLAKGVKIAVASMRIVTYEINAIKSNITTINNNTRSLLDTGNQLLTKQFFNNAILELKQQPAYSLCPRAPSKTTNQLPKNCKEVMNHKDMSGIYKIQPEHSSKPYIVYCEMTTKNGGWTVIHNRYEGAQDFYQNWHEYKYGFGNLGGEFWLGLDNIHLLTGYEVNELLIEMEDFDNRKAYAHYGSFSVGPEVEGYPLKVLGGYNGDAGDSLTYHAGYRFSTKDNDQDAWAEGSCAQAHGGGWWYHGCDTCNLNGRYLSGDLPEHYVYNGMYWGEFRGAEYSLFKARMLVRPRDHYSPPMFTYTETNETLQNY